MERIVKFKTVFQVLCVTKLFTALMLSILVFSWMSKLPFQLYFTVCIHFLRWLFMMLFLGGNRHKLAYAIHTRFEFFLGNNWHLLFTSNLFILRELGKNYASILFYSVVLRFVLYHYCFSKLQLSIRFYPVVSVINYVLCSIKFIEHST